MSAPTPLLYLYPLNDTFVAKHIALTEGSPVMIGRQCERIAPDNGHFDHKVMSRKHAQIWAEGKKIYLKDTKSVNGTYLNGERLSLEDVESNPVELKNGDVVEFGIDILDDDKKTIIHPKAAARVDCIFQKQPCL